MILTTVLGGFRLDLPAALSWARTIADGNPGGIRETYRTYAEQAARRAYYLADRRRHPFALPPGQSKHEDGTAVDALVLATAWLVKHGAEYGWRRTNTREPWHWEYFLDLDQHRNPVPVTVTSPAPTPATLNIEGGTMRAVATPSGRRFVLGELTYQDMTAHWEHASHEAHIWNPDTAGEPQVIDDATLDLAVGQIQQRRAQLAEALKAMGL